MFKSVCCKGVMPLRRARDTKSPAFILATWWRIVRASRKKPTKTRRILSKIFSEPMDSSLRALTCCKYSTGLWKSSEKYRWTAMIGFTARIFRFTTQKWYRRGTGWMGSETRVAVFIVFAYYFFTPILFCHIVDEGGICVEVEGKRHAGWMSSLYFASTTLSTVGYGDLTVEKDTRWRTFIGVAYMILSVGLAVVAFSAAADNALTPLGDLWTKVSNYLIGEPDPDAFLYQRIRRIKFVRLGRILFKFLALNLLGTVVSKAFVPFTVDGEEMD